MKKIFIISVLVALVSACSSTPNLEDYANDPDGMWQEGKKLSEKGEKLISKGESTLEDARKELREGEILIQSGTDAIIRARQDYQNEATLIGNSSTPQEVEFEAEKLNAIGERWEDAIDDIKKGNNMVSKSKKLQTKAQEQISEGRRLVEKGAGFIRNSQRIRLNVPLLPDSQ